MKEIEQFTHLEALNYITTVMLPYSSPMLVASLQLHTENKKAVRAIEHFEVVLSQQFRVFHATQRGLLLIDKVLGLEPYTIPIGAQFKAYSTYPEGIGLVALHINAPIALRLTTALQEEIPAAISILCKGYAIPTEKYVYRPDMRWIAAWDEEYLASHMEHFHFAPGGTIMHVIVDGVSEPPTITLGGGKKTLIEPTQVEDTAWLFDYTTGAEIIPTRPSMHPMRTLNAEITADIALHVSPSRNPVKVLTHKAYLNIRP